MADDRPAPRTRISREARRALIVEAARSEFIASGSQGARTKTIAERAGIAEAMIYQHFKSKDDLFQAAIVQPLEENVVELFAAGPTLASDRPDLQRANTAGYVRSMLEALAESGPLLGLVLFSDRTAGESFFQKKIAPILDSVIHVVDANYDVWSHRAFNSQMTVPATFGMCWFLTIDALYRGRTLDIDELVPQIVSLLFDGVDAMQPERNTDVE